jgi:hypothetical protein
MRTAAGFNADDALRRQRFGTHQNLHIFFGVNIIGDDGDVVSIAQSFAQRFDQRGLARAYRATDAYS